ncbi:MAG TPA: hypothetical protein VK821_07440 [Dehalococcoidia bacterium]|nr:hypothetical protein [Dehalococcoidia bacterium]
MSELQPGIYEALLTELLAKRLPADERLYRLGSLDRADAPALLARHIASIIEIALRTPSLEDKPANQVEFCNRLIDALAGQRAAGFALDDLLDRRAQQLLEVSRAPQTPLARREALSRPTTPLSQNALLVASKHEPVLAAELKRELASADRVDLLCAFVRWSGIRVLMDALRQARDRGVPVRVITTTYTGATETRALDELAALGADIRVS